MVTSLAIVVRSKDEVDQSYDISMRAAREMAAAGCDIVVLGGVPINLSRGAANAEQIIRDLEAELKVKVSTTTSAQAAAAKALGCKKVVVASPTKSRDRPHRQLRQTFRLRGAGRDRLGLGLQPDRPHSAPCRDRHGPRADAQASRTPIRSCSRRRIGRPPARSTCWSASSASIAWRRTRRSSGTRCAAAASRTASRASAGCSGSSELRRLKTMQTRRVLLALAASRASAARPASAQQPAIRAEPPPLQSKPAFPIR